MNTGKERVLKIQRSELFFSYGVYFGEQSGLAFLPWAIKLQLKIGPIDTFDFFPIRTSCGSVHGRL